MPADLLKELPGYDPDVQKNRAQARHIMEQLGYGPDNRLKIKVSTRDLPPHRDPAVILIDQLKEVFRRRARNHRHHRLLSQDPAQGLCRRSQHFAKRARSRPDPRCALRLRFEPEPERLLQLGGRQADRPAIARARPGTAQTAGLGNRAQACRGRRPADHLLQPLRDLLAALCQGADDHGQQPHKRQSHGRRLARQ